MKPLRILRAIGLLVLFGLTVQAHDTHAPLNDEQKAFLSQYESANTALAADDLGVAKKAAAGIVTESKAPPKEPLTSEQTERQVAFVATVKMIVTAIRPSPLAKVSNNLASAQYITLKAKRAITLLTVRWSRSTKAIGCRQPNQFVIPILEGRC